jgi:hypothetical protein
MSLHGFFEWLAHTPLSVALNGSSYWYFGLVMAAHLLGVALLGGTALLMDLRVLGTGLRAVSPKVLARALSPWFLAGLALVLGTGLWMLVADPLKYYVNDAFRLKAALLVAVLVLQGIVYRHARRLAEHGAGAGFLLKTGAVLSVTLWLGVTVAGRVVGLI